MAFCCCSTSNRLVNDSCDMDSRVYSYSIGVENSYLVGAGSDVRMNSMSMISVVAEM